MSEKITPDLIEKWTEAFDRFDLDDNGAISMRELMAFLEERCADRTQALDICCSIKQDADKNDDDRITKEEFLSAMKAKCGE